MAVANAGYAPLPPQYDSRWDVLGELPDIVGRFLDWPADPYGRNPSQRPGQYPPTGVNPPGTTPPNVPPPPTSCMPCTSPGQAPGCLPCQYQANGQGMPGQTPDWMRSCMPQLAQTGAMPFQCCMPCAPTDGSCCQQPAAPSKPPKVDVPSTPACVTVTVRRGDTLSCIAAKHGVSWQQLYWHNREQIKHPDLIYPGQKFTIPPCDLKVPPFSYTPMFGRSRGKHCVVITPPPVTQTPPPVTQKPPPVSQSPIQR